MFLDFVRLIFCSQISRTKSESNIPTFDGCRTKLLWFELSNNLQSNIPTVAVILTGFCNCVNAFCTEASFSYQFLNHEYCKFFDQYFLHWKAKIMLCYNYLTLSFMLRFFFSFVYFEIWLASNKPWDILWNNYFKLVMPFSPKTAKTEISKNK